MFTWGLFLLMLHAFSEAGGRLQSKSAEGWTISSPNRIRATRTSCMVVPCTFNFPHSEVHKKKIHRGLWKKEKEEVVAAANSVAYAVNLNFERRTRVLGNVTMKNCTWTMAGVTVKDAGLYFFRFELPETKKFAYSWKLKPTMLEVIEPKKPEMTVTATGAFCSVVHCCPTHPPTFKWNHNGTAMTLSRQVDEWQYMTFSLLNFCPGDLELPLTLNCTVRYYGGAKRSSIASIV